MALFGPGTNIIDTDPIQQALARRQSGMPANPVMEQKSGAFPGLSAPAEPKITPGQTSSPMPDTLAQMQRRAGQAGGVGVEPNSEMSMIIKALIDRMKQIGKAEEQGNQIAQPSPANDWEVPGPVNLGPPPKTIGPV